MNLKNLRKDVLERTKDLTPVSERLAGARLSEGRGDRRWPTTAPGFAAALYAARERIRALEEALDGIRGGSAYESLHQETRGLNAELKNAWHRIDWLEETLREHGLSIPDSRT
ncbi:hypothetical protein [Burkholderia multivorans]|uniref:hypothetical protein n=1 Tax=Burkholderia multivorans TaxID=87883 RepID=UPI0020195FAD|nr:hypothetical protein [Burkholderia multivorans]MCL4629237.1 hypothetical protein [Burkholderia multivorans]MCO1388463.1 hypothetical protein [Burkholderia multivorans]UQO11618.1 hypothetical protein L0Z40_00720 [Burkholderia multivorans]UQO56503.1 hypothetical protein L0Z30_24630 [Burkholderia multivorans]UQO60125.1 hypothetical protein L0Z29_14970 [Burkholderia multivorans]